MQHSTKPPSIKYLTNQLLFSLTTASITLLSLSIFYNDYHLPTSRQFFIAQVAQMTFLLIWRNYVYARMVPKSNCVRSSNGSSSNNVNLEASNVNFYTMHIWHLSCLLFLLGNCLIPLQIIYNQLRDDGDPFIFGMVCATCHGFIDVMLGLNIILDVIGSGLKKSGECINTPWFRSMVLNIYRKMQRYRSVAIFLLSAKIVLTGVLIANEDPIVVKIEVPIRNLPDSLDGFRIIQLSDMHIGVSVGKSRVKRAVEIVNELCTKKEEEKCQLVAFTGDVIDGEPYRLRKAIEPLKGLVQVPKLFVTGNHEHIHRNVEHAVELLSEMGIDSIINDNIRLPTDSKEQVVVVGLSDYSFRQPNAEQKAFEGTTKDDTILLLAHQPNHLQIARRHDVNLMLSGHTHAGQFFPGTLGAWLFNAKYSGFYGGETNVYVSAGTCWWGPPVRFTTRHHEIADVRLRKVR